MIPKVIHYCWFGRNPMPKLAYECIRSWKKKCPEYDIIEWNEDNYDISSAPLYVKQAYELKKWAFVTDYVRLQIIYEHGGIYLDTDVELLKTLDTLLTYEGFFGFEDGRYIATGIGFGAVAGLSILKEMMEDYYKIPFVSEDGTVDLTPCPVRNTKALLKWGLRQDNSFQALGKQIAIFPAEFFCPKDWKTGAINITKNTVSIHHYDASWYTEEEKLLKLQRYKEFRWNHIRTMPNRLLKRILGDSIYECLKEKLK